MTDEELKEIITTVMIEAMHEELRKEYLVNSFDAANLIAVEKEFNLKLVPEDD